MSISINFQEQQKNTMMPGMNGVVSAGQNGEQKKTLYAGNLNLGIDPKQQRLEEARKKAYKVVSDAFGADRDFDRQLDEIRKYAIEQRDEKAAAMSDKKTAEDMIDALRKEYNVDPESREQEDLDWIMAWRKQPLEEKLDNPDFVNNVERAKGIMENLTEYQFRMLEANEQLDHALERIGDADNALVAIRQSLTDAETEKNKTHAMADAQDEAETIMDEANRAVIGIAMNEAKDNIEEKMKEEQEKAEEKKEEKEEQEEIEAERAEKKSVQEALTEETKEAVKEAREEIRKRKADDFDLTDVLGSDTTAMTDRLSNVNAALDDIKNKMALVDADLKGIRVDEII